MHMILQPFSWPSIRLQDYYQAELIRSTCLESRLLPVKQGGDTPIYSVLRSSSSVKIKVKGQPPKIADSQKSNCLLAGQESTSSFT